MILEQVTKLRAKSKKKPEWLDAALPAVQFAPSSAASFAFVNLMRELIKDRGYQIKKGDAMDLQHAVMATAFSNFAALDKQWKRRVGNLPRPNQNPRVYYEPELEMMVTDIRLALAHRTRTEDHEKLRTGRVRLTEFPLVDKLRNISSVPLFHYDR